MRVWVTRAQPGADATARRLLRMGHAPLVAPTLEVTAFERLAIDLAGVAALAFTSANGVRAFAALSNARDLPVFAVGDATAAAAQAAGFAKLHSACGDVSDLARLIIARPCAGLLLHPGARHLAGDLVGELVQAGVRARALAVYETLERQTLPQAVADALSTAQLDAVLLHSPSAARTVARLVGRPPHFAQLGALRVVGLSTACIAPLDALPFGPRSVAVHPREDALLAELARP